jgi:probable phosphoglycerate mutase
MIRILLVRHGSTDLLGRVLYGRMPGVHLNDEGVQQAEAVGRMLRSEYRLAEVVSSPLERAMETAERIAVPQELRITIDEGITEIDFGSWMGKAFTELSGSNEWARYNRARSVTSPPDGEFLTAVQARACRTLDRIAARHPDPHNAAVAVVSHGDVIRALLLLFLGMSVDHIHRLEIAPASVSEVVMGQDEPVIRYLNRCVHCD